MSTTKFKKTVYLFLLIGLFFIAAFYTMRVYHLNQKYPSSEIINGTQDFPIIWNGLEIKLSKGELTAQESFFSSYKVDSSSIFSDSSAELYALFDISVPKLEENQLQNYFYLDYAGAEKDGWKNLISPELFHALNPSAKPISQMNPGETQHFLLAIGLHQSAFTKQNWKNLKIDQLSLVLSIYPQKISLRYT